MVSADPFCVATARSSLLDHCSECNHHHHLQHPHHGRASVQLALDKSSASTSSSSASSSPSPVPTRAPPCSKVQQRSREVTSRYKSPSRDIASRYRSPPPSAHLSSTSPRRYASPTVERSTLDTTPPSKRAVSAERHRPSPTTTGVESKLASVSNGDGSCAFPPRHIFSSTSSARSDLHRRTTKNLHASVQPESYSNSTKSPAKARHESRGRTSSNLSSDSTLKPSPNSAQRLSEQHRITPERKSTPLRRHSSDQLENAKPAEGAKSKPEQVLKHRWHSSLSILKLYGNALSKSVDVRNDREKSTGRARSVAMLHSRPTSFSSQVIPRVLPNTSGIFSHTVNEGPASSVLRTAARKLSTENKSRMIGRDSPIKSKREAHNANESSRSSAASSRSGNSWDLGRYPAREAELASEVYEREQTQGAAKGCPSTSFGMARGVTVSTRSLSDLSAGKVRIPSEAQRLQNSVISDSGNSRGIATGRHLSTRQKHSLTSDTRAAYSASPPWPGSPNHLAPAYKPAQHQSLSPLRISSRLSSLRSWPSPAGSRVLASLSPSGSTGYSSALQFVADLRKSRKGLSQVEATYLHRILHNRLLQWRFANALADLTNMTHRQEAEKLLFSVWAKTAEIRKSVTSKRIKLQQAWQAHKINRILRVQGAKLGKWASIQQDHSNALSGAVEALEATVLRIPVSEGIKADIQAVKEAMNSAVDLVHVLESFVNCLLPKTEKTTILLSELAQVADQEQTFLEECGDLLIVASSLEVEERSLHMQVVQFEQEKARLLGHLMTGGD